MRCHICDAPLAEVQVNSDFGDFEPCPTCLTVIKDTVAGFTDRPSVEEDELGRDDTVSAYGLLTEDFSPEYL
jgi:hypothetical protein